MKYMYLDTNSHHILSDQQNAFRKRWSCESQLITTVTSCLGKCLKRILTVRLNKANTSDTEAAFLDLHLSISNDIVSPKFMINAMTLILKLSISHF